MALSFKPRRGRPPFPRVEFTQALLDHVSQEKIVWPLARLAGFPHYSAFSAFLHRRTIPASRLTVARFHTLADVLGIARDDVFRKVAR